ncbi:MAG: recombinase family protein [Blautia massiliensis (ex Durand et al. 2017)]
MGDALLAKTYTVDFLTKKRVKNNGIVPQYYVENSHEPIVPRDLYMQVQEEMVRRANLHSGENRKKGFTAVNMRYPALFTARNAVKFTEELRGTTEESAPQ